MGTWEAHGGPRGNLGGTWGGGRARRAESAGDRECRGSRVQGIESAGAVGGGRAMSGGGPGGGARGGGGSRAGGGEAGGGPWGWGRRVEGVGGRGSMALAQNGEARHGRDHESRIDRGGMIHAAAVGGQGRRVCQQHRRALRGLHSGA